MHEIPYLKDVVILFGTALVMLAICNRFRIPSIIGFLFTGLLTGPSTLGWIKDSHHIEIFAELGVVFLLFIIGLELHFERLKKLIKPMLVGGSLQAALTLLAIITAAWGLGFGTKTGFFWGMVITLSSTAIVLTLYQERNEIETPHGQTALGILLFQDFLIVPFILIVPILGGSMDGTGLQIAFRFGGGLLLIGAMLVLGRFVLPHLLHLIVLTRVRELLVLGALFICLGAALATEAAGFSLALGAFLAGILISESDYHYQIESEITPFRDVFNSVFFISIGMLINIKFFISHWQTVLIIAGTALVIKTIILLVVTSLLFIPWRTKFIASTSLAQIGEFSFILISTGYFYKLIPYDHYQYAISVTVLTMLLTPVLISTAPLLFRVSQKSIAISKETDLSGHIIISGHGLTGQHLVRVLQSANIPYIVTEINGQKVKQNKKLGTNIIYGDSSKRTILEKCGINSASVLVTAISDPYALRQTIKLARQINPDIFIIARSNRLDEIQELVEFGASHVIAQEFESSIEIVTNVLERLHMPQNIIRMEEKILRQDGYQMLRQPATTSYGISDKIMDLLAEGVTTTFMVLETHYAVNKKISDLDLRKQTGATILAVMRGDKPNKNPAPDLELSSGDVLILTGAHAEIDNAFAWLEKGGN